ncbi:sensor domain-containing diguanylate cyclase [Kaistia geumhonensis]|uniref:diguanylate cyclase n=1 Tax=Kaistia geumhonensis TaxID=410839 RepID=A0ABU0M3X4_9HYPH|nr:sensor domain-containing diguanylate cyclase [Kaistia geumhonensis]MCX5479114.1 sensor domain-containing diguanylate cyclase [Kaistia geumhonensis]MDQ0515666.1 diguanylate cyclase (GGDEF)-like protein [Kaistia geumhonensis]
MWTPPPPPADEPNRLDELYSYGLLDTPPEERFDRITRIASRVYGADVAFLSFVDAGQQWMKSKTSDALHDFIERDRSVCTHVISTGEPLVIEDMRSSPQLAGHPLAADLPWRFYASVPIRGVSSSVVGTLCVMRSEAGPPADFNLEILSDLAAITGHELNLTLQNAKLRSDSYTDSLTGLFNRRKLDEELPRAVRRAVRTAAPVSLLLIDLDHFKEINDSLGHAGGDRVLAEFGRLLAPFARRPDDVICRFGGEEFALILPGSSADGAVTVAGRLLHGLNEAEIRHPTRGRLTASIGIADHALPEDHADWLARADQALYAAKALGRATFSLA